MIYRKLLLLILVCPLLLYSQKKSLSEKIIPHHAVLQYAGSIGFLSAGAGYSTNNKKIAVELLYGFVPASVGGIEIHSATIKFNWSPLWRRYNNISVSFINTGLYANYVFGKQYFAYSPAYYPFDYYDYPTAIHAGFFMGSAVSKGIFSFYYELGTTQEELLSFLANTKSLSLADIANLGVGVRVGLR